MKTISCIVTLTFFSAAATTLAQQPSWDQLPTAVAHINNNGNIFPFGSTIIAWGQGRDSLSISTDGGDNWTTRWINLETNPTCSNLQEGVDFVYFQDQNTGYAFGACNMGTGYKFQKTTDQGRTWIATGYVGPESDWHSWNMQFVSPTTGFYTDGLFLYKTVNGGTSFSKINTSGFSIENVNQGAKFAFYDANYGYVIGIGWDNSAPQKQYITARTTDGGNTWTLIEMPGRFSTSQAKEYTCIAFKPGDRNTLWLGAYNSVNSSNQGGRFVGTNNAWSGTVNWSQIYFNGMAAGGPTGQIQIMPDNYIWASTGDTAGIFHFSSASDVQRFPNIQATSLSMQSSDSGWAIAGNAVWHYHVSIPPPSHFSVCTVPSEVLQTVRDNTVSYLEQARQVLVEQFTPPKLTSVSIIFQKDASVPSWTAITGTYNWPGNTECPPPRMLLKYLDAQSLLNNPLDIKFVTAHELTHWIASLIATGNQWSNYEGLADWGAFCVHKLDYYWKKNFDTLISKIRRADTAAINTFHDFNPLAATTRSDGSDGSWERAAECDFWKFCLGTNSDPTKPDPQKFKDLIEGRLDPVLCIGPWKAQYISVQQDSCECNSAFTTLLNDTSGKNVPTNPSWKSPTQIAINPYTKDLIAVHTFYPFRSTDMGQSWDRDASLIRNGIETIVKSIAFASSNKVFLGTYFGIWKSDSSGRSKSWSRNFLGPNNDTIHIWNIVNNSKGDLFACTIEKGIYRSTNRGVTWDSINNGLRINGFLPQSIMSIVAIGDTLLACSPPYSNGAIIRTESVFRSTNKGNSWIRMNPINTQGVLLCYNTDDRKIYGLSQETLYVSSDYGNSWNTLTTLQGKLKTFPFDFYISNRASYITSPLWSDTSNIARGALLLKSTDCGKNWVEFFRDSSGIINSLAHLRKSCGSLQDSIDITYLGGWKGIQSTCDKLSPCRTPDTPVLNKTFNVCSDGKIVTLPVVKGRRYCITVSGTYSMWKRNTRPDSCYGVDGAYVYDVPGDVRGKEWSQNYPLPVWVGSNDHVGFDTISVVPKYNVGFRVNGLPINAPIMDSIHSYHFTIQSNYDTVVRFQILDSISNRNTGNVYPRYNDNCGCLSVVVEDCAIDTCGMQIDYDTITVKCKDTSILGHYARGIQLQAKIWQTDPNDGTGRKNILHELQDTSSLHKLGVVVDGSFICPIDSIRCKSQQNDTIRNNLAVGLLVDKSGSMTDSIDPSDTTKKINAAKKSLKGFIKYLHGGKDTVFLMSFDATTHLVRDWTSNSTALDSGVSSINPSGSTSVYTAVITALQKIDNLQAQGYKKSLIILSDGEDNDPNAFTTTHVMDTVRNKHIPIYIVALSFKDTSQLGQVARVSGGKLFSVNKADSLVTLFQNLATDIVSEECCTIYFHSDNLCSCDTNDEHFIRLIYAPIDTLLSTFMIKYKCKYPKICCAKSDVERLNDNSNTRIYPNPFSQAATISCNSQDGGAVSITVRDVYGNVKMTHDRYLHPGENNVIIDGKGLPPGTYFVLIRTQQTTVIKKFILMR